MVRTIYEMEENDALESNSLSDTLAYCIVAGDYLRARRRRFALNIISDKINGDGFMEESRNSAYFFRYGALELLDLTYFIFDSYKEYVDD